MHNFILTINNLKAIAIKKDCLTLYNKYIEIRELILTYF